MFRIPSLKERLISHDGYGDIQYDKMCLLVTSQSKFDYILKHIQTSKYIRA